jgi:hypothetical protein
MARPIKDNADYFSHDADMRDDPKIKALRRKFKVAGYGVWCMLLESITDADNFRLKIDIEIMAGDYDVETEFLQEVIRYCVQLDLLQTDEAQKMLWSKTLDNRFITLVSKRKRKRAELWTPETPQNGVKDVQNPTHTVLIDVHNTQSKVKESKVKERDIQREEFYHSNQKAFEDISNNYLETEPQRNILNNRGWRAATKTDTDALLFHFLESQADLNTPKSNVKNHFKKWLNKRPLDELQTLAKTINERLSTKVC